ncbi:rhodanese-like domain-containing protein [Thalassomonas sp. M1454]|uniref:rhodanese-like domain-containing protein n=1 Tax=Thalassomonas sp. M1454 TaxID=2594477 RepID=UPI0011801E15|nr:rhodanese-like domain-containing protein [Thalassomonas sp. M1454]TRX58180.1 rhodanese-like domain-containing protein [Thalassomonas sp. M1454]
MEQLITFAENNAMLSMAWLAIASMLVFITIKSKLSPVKEINTQELTLLVNREDAQVIDIRSEADFKKGHILGSKHLAVEKINNNQLQGLEKAKDKPIIVVCTAGMTALPVARKLLKAGFSQVSSLKGGFSGWQSANLPVTK